MTATARAFIPDRPAATDFSVRPPCLSRRARAVRQGRCNALAGLLAEDCVERLYRAEGAEVVERRHRGPAGEIDLIAREGDVLVFVEVKRKRAGADADTPVSERQWRRLEAAATQYILTSATGAAAGCRFDVAVVGHDAVARIYKNARSFDEA